jgi:hypothetical protein
MNSSNVTLTVVAPLKLSMSWRNGLPELRVSGQTGATYSIEYVPALTTGAAWLNLTNFSLTISPMSFLDHTASNVQGRFYRVRRGP